MPKPMIAQITDVLRGRALGNHAPLLDYSRAKLVRDALHRKDPAARLSAIREALNQHKVTAWAVGDKIELRSHGETLLTLQKSGIPNHQN